MIRKFYLRMLLASALMISPFASQYIHAQWSYVGRPGFSPSGAPHVQHTEMVINEANELYVAFADYGYTPVGEPSGTVMKYTDTGWRTIGNPGFTPGWSNHCAMALGKGDTVYYAFADGTPTGFSRGRVMRFDGNSWDFLGDVLTVSECKFTNIEVASDGTVYFGATDRGPGGFVDGAMVVKRYTGSSWVTVGATHPASGTAKAQSGYMTIDRNDTLWIVYSDVDDGTKLTVKKFNGTDWVKVGSSFLEGQFASFIGAGDPNGIHLAFDYNNTPYVVYSAVNMAAPNLTVHKFNGTDWVLVGDAYFTKSLHISPVVTRGRLAFDRSNTPYVAFWDQAGVGGVANLPHVMKFDGTTWVHVGAPGFVNDVTAWHSLVIDGNGNPYVTFYDGSQDGKISVMKYSVCEAPTATTAAASSTDVCVGDTVTLTVTGTLNDATDWEWYEGSCDGTVVGNGNIIYVVPTDTTTYYVRGLGNCVVSGGCASVKVNVTNVPKPTFGADGDTLVSSSPVGNQWYLDGTPIPGANGQKYGITKTGSYSVKVTIGPCSAESDPQDLIPTSISAGTERTQIRLFPVPFEHSVQLEINADGMQDWRLQISDQVGRIVYQQQQLGRKNEIDLAHLTPGMYMIRVYNASGTVRVFKAIKQ